jgi:hypothetical protein
MEIKYLRLFKGGLSLGGAIFMVFLLGFEGYTFAIVHNQSRARLPENYGNFERVRNSLEEQGSKEEFSFAVVGDTSETCTFERLCDKLRDEGLSFMVMLGGFVLNCEKGSYDYFSDACIRKYRLPFPVFLVVSDHDIVYDKMNFDIGNVSLADFENRYGPSNFFFEYNGCLFIGLCLLPPPYPTSGSLEFLDSILAKYADRNRKVFIFAHRLSPLLDSSAKNRPEKTQDLEDIVSRYKVDYVVTAHNYSYTRKEKEGTTYFIPAPEKSDACIERDYLETS